MPVYHYEVHPRSSLGRKKDRANYRADVIHSIVNEAPVLHVSFQPSTSSVEPFPVILPMIGQMGLFVEPNADIGSQPFDLYVHGHVSSRLMALPNEDDLPVCVAATILDGIVLALSPFNNSCNYRSVILYGNATIVTDEAERLYAMQLITNGLVPNRWENSRIPPTKVELDQTQILKITLCSASAKVRTSGPTYDRRDLKDKSLCGTVWSGVVPVQQRLGSPKAGDKNEIAFPDYLHHWRQEINSRGNRILI